MIEKIFLCTMLYYEKEVEYDGFTENYPDISLVTYNPCDDATLLSDLDNIIENHLTPYNHPKTLPVYVPLKAPPVVVYCISVIATSWLAYLLSTVTTSNAHIRGSALNSPEIV